MAKNKQMICLVELILNETTKNKKAGWQIKTVENRMKIWKIKLIKKKFQKQIGKNLMKFRYFHNILFETSTANGKISFKSVLFLSRMVF